MRSIFSRISRKSLSSLSDRAGSQLSIETILGEAILGASLRPGRLTIRN
ncbi:MAG: hypothetical protein IGR93_13270 [Hydrococcus sp. C42_A2020_068]|nr:hypothetical protein [Hydrococcus sp. C42_A2020_068]